MHSNNQKDKTMRKQYEQFLVQHGYSARTGKLQKSTIANYLSALSLAAHLENMTLEQLAANIDTITIAYSQGGPKAETGKLRSRALRSSLVQFSRFVKEQAIATC